MRMRQRKTRLSKDKLTFAVTRLLLPGLAVVAVAAASGAYSLARIVEDARPDLALSIMPSLAPSLGAKADRLIAESRGRDGRLLAEARQAAQKSLRASPLNPAALRVVAVTGEMEEAERRRLLATALDVSRRDTGTQLLQIEFDVARGDIDATLRHYDQALSVRPSVGATLYPVLLSASEEPAVLAAARRMVASDPKWLPGLIGWSLENPEFLRPLTRLVSAFPPGSDARAPGYGQALVEQLVNRREWAAAFAAHRAYAPRASGSGFERGFIYRPIDWTVSDNYEYGAQLITEPTPRVRFFADPGARGVFLHRLAALPPGRYRLTLAIDSPGDASGSGGLLISCQTQDTDSGLSEAQFPARGTRVHHFTIPARSCPYQWVRFSVAADESAIEADLTRIRIDRESGPATS